MADLRGNFCWGWSVGSGENLRRARKIAICGEKGKSQGSRNPPESKENSNLRGKGEESRKVKTPGEQGK